MRLKSRVTSHADRNTAWYGPTFATRDSRVVTEWYEEWFGEDYLRLYPHRDDADAERAVALIAKTLELRPGWRVLDVGCGAGRHTRAFADRGARCIGLDLSAALLRLARQTGSRRGQSPRRRPS